MCARRALRAPQRAATPRRSRGGSSSTALRSRRRTGRCCSARWLIPSESAEVLSTDRRVTWSIEESPAAALIAIRCRTPSIPTDPIAMNTVRIPSNASVRSRGSSRRVGRMCSPSGSPKARRALSGSRTSAATASPRASTPRTISLPTRPVAPITAVDIASTFGEARSVRTCPASWWRASTLVTRT